MCCLGFRVIAVWLYVDFRNKRKLGLKNKRGNKKGAGHVALILARILACFPWLLGTRLDTVYT